LYTLLLTFREKSCTSARSLFCEPTLNGKISVLPFLSPFLGRDSYNFLKSGQNSYMENTLIGIPEQEYFFLLGKDIPAAHIFMFLKKEKKKSR